MTKQRIVPLVGLCLFAALPLVASATDKGQQSRKPQSMNSALKLKPTDPELNFLNGVAYEQAAMSGSQSRELARIGYQTALRYDPGYWQAHIRLGKMAMEDRNGLEAEHHFLSAAMFSQDDVALFYDLARAAYCAGDIATAVTAFGQAARLKSPTADQSVTEVLLAAAQGQPEDAAHGLAKLTEQRVAGLPVLVRRVRELNQQYVGAMGSGNSATVQAPTASQPPKPSNMAMLDVVVLRQNESGLTSQGINLLDALTLQFGSTLINANQTKTTDRLAGTTTSNLADKSSGVLMTVPTITYSLNIANARGGKSTIDARPTLLIYNGETSKLFSGGDLTFATDGQLSSQSFTKEAGLSLEVKPKFSADGTVTLTVQMVLETFLDSSEAGNFKQSVQTEKSTTSVVADLKYGQTILVSNAQSASNENASSKTPLLGSLPLIRNLFDSRTKSFSNTNVMVVMTLRRNDATDAANSAVSEQADIVRMRADLEGLLGLPRSANVAFILPEKYRDFYVGAN